MADHKAPTSPPAHDAPPPPPPAPRRVEVGEPPITRLERDMGLAINPKTGRAYTDQGEFQNMGLGASGRFFDGVAVPRTVRCAGCGGTVTEKAWAVGFENCGALDLGPGGRYFLCPGCIELILGQFKNTLRGLVAARNGGRVR